MAAFAPRSENDAFLLRADYLVRGYIAKQGSGFRLRAEYWNAAARRSVRTLDVAVPRPDQVLELSQRLAAIAGVPPGPDPTRSLHALRSYSLAITAHSSEEAERHYRAGIQADPDFGPAYLGLAEACARRGDAEGFQQVIAQAAGRNLPAWVRARLDLTGASIAKDDNRRLSALERLSRLTPADTDLRIAAGSEMWRRRKVSDALRWFHEASRLEPTNGDGWNLLAYAQAYEGHFADALKSLERYRAVSPSDPNALDSTGEIYFLMGRFEEAGRAFLEASQLNRDFLDGAPLRKAAFARLFSGDPEGAREQYQLYADYRRGRGDLLADFRQAQFQYLTGDRQRARRVLQAVAAGSGAPPVLRIQAAMELRFWSWLEGDTAAASGWSESLKVPADTRLAAGPAAVLSFLTLPAAGPEEWVTRASRAFPAGFPRAAADLALGLALVKNGHFSAAVPVWERLINNVEPGADGFFRVLSGWCLFESGKLADARRRLEAFPLPPAEEETSYWPVIVPRYFELRARIAERDGRRAEAERMRQVLRALSANAPG